MKLKIESRMPIRDLQKDFNNCFPYLKIEFFERCDPKNHSGRIKKINPDQLVGNLTSHDGHHIVDIAENRTVGEIENDFAKILDLPVQVFRKSGNIWIETSLTDNWTLEKQNAEGASFSHISNNTIEERRNNKQVDTD